MKKVSKISDSWPRQKTSLVSSLVIVEALAGPKKKLSGHDRRAFLRKLSRVIIPPLETPKTDVQRTVERLSIRPLSSLLKRKRRLEGLIRNGKRLSDELPADSMARRLVNDDVQRWEGYLVILDGLVKQRVSGPPKRDCTPHKKRKP